MVWETAAFQPIYEDEHTLAVCKSAGGVAHPSYKNADGTLKNAVDDWYAQQNKPAPWLMHRLDKDTSGVVLFARTEFALKMYAKQFKRHTTVKWYIAIVNGCSADSAGMIHLPLLRDPEDRRRVISGIDGAAAETRYIRRIAGAQVSLLYLQPVTGRTHQLRAHTSLMGFPVLGDTVYNARDQANPDREARMYLHAAALSIMAPECERSVTRRFFYSAPPKEFYDRAPELAQIDLASELAALIAESFKQYSM